MKKIEKEYICIACPIGCRLKLIAESAADGSGAELSVSGNKCRRGEIYAKEEYSEPKRIVTATCRIGMENLERLPVKTDKPILKEHIDTLLKDIYALKISAPVKRGDLLITDYRGTGVNIVAARSAG